MSFIEKKCLDKRHMKPINDISKRHSEYQNDIPKRQQELLAVFQNQLEKTLCSGALKIGKIVSAIYLVTDVMEVDLPLTHSLRGESLELLNACYGLLTGTAITIPEVSRVIVRLEQVISLVQIGKISHHISDMNAEIIQIELSRVLELFIGEVSIMNQKYAGYTKSIAAPQPTLSHTILGDELFDQVSKERSMMHGTTRGVSTPLVGIIPKTPEVSQNDIKTTFSKTTSINDISDIKTVDKTKNVVNKIKTTFKTTSANFEKTDRKQDILNVIKSHKDASIQDIKKYITDCSDKTLQRDIANLIEAGIIVREGNKRWTTYKIINL